MLKVPSKTKINKYLRRLSPSLLLILSRPVRSLNAYSVFYGCKRRYNLQKNFLELLQFISVLKFILQDDHFQFSFQVFTLIILNNYLTKTGGYHHINNKCWFILFKYKMIIQPSYYFCFIGHNNIINTKYLRV